MFLFINKNLYLFSFALQSNNILSNYATLGHNNLSYYAHFNFFCAQIGVLVQYSPSQSHIYLLIMCTRYYEFVHFKF